MSTVYGKYVSRSPVITGNDDWRHDSVCRDEDPELFFPVGHSGPALLQEEEAKRICLTCPARAACLQYAVDNDITDGVWGGLGELELRWARRQKAKAGRSS